MKIFSIFVLALVLASTGFSQEIFNANKPGETRNRSYHVLHYKIEVTLPDTAQSLDGKVTTTLVPLLPKLSTVVFDAGDMKIKRVTDAKGRALKYFVTPESLSIDLGRAYSSDEKVTVSVEYSSTSTKGLTFNNTDLKIPASAPKSGRREWRRRIIIGFRVMITRMTRLLRKSLEPSVRNIPFCRMELSSV